MHDMPSVESALRLYCRRSAGASTAGDSMPEASHPTARMFFPDCGDQQPANAVPAAVASRRMPVRVATLTSVV